MTTAASHHAPFSEPDTAGSARLEAAFERCAGALYRYLAVRVGGDGHLADDLMQQLWLHGRNLGATPAEEVEYRLRVVARNLLRTHWRRVGRGPVHVPLPDPGLASELAGRLTSAEGPGACLERREVQDQLLLAITELPAGQQDLLVAHYFLGRPQVQLAAELGVSVRAIEGRLYRVRTALREKLEHLEPL